MSYRPSEHRRVAVEIPSHKRPACWDARTRAANNSQTCSNAAWDGRWWAILYTMGYFALGAVAFGYLASSNGPTILHVFYWVLAGLSFGLAALVGARAVERIVVRRRVALTPACLLLPKPGWSGEEVAIDYGAITGLFISAGDYAPWACRVPIDWQATTGLPTRNVRRARFCSRSHLARANVGAT